VPGKRNLPSGLRFDRHRFYRQRLGIKSVGNEYVIDRTILENGGSGMVRVGGTEDENWHWLAGEDEDCVSGQKGVWVEDLLDEVEDPLDNPPTDSPKDNHEVPKRLSLKQLIDAKVPREFVKPDGKVDFNRWAIAARMDEFERRVFEHKQAQISRERAMALRQDEQWRKGVQRAWRSLDRDSGEERLRTTAERLKRNKNSGLPSKMSRRRY
jgi:hypothetical protein